MQTLIIVVFVGLLLVILGLMIYLTTIEPYHDDEED